MSKAAKVSFVVFNTVFFILNFMSGPYWPNGLVFGFIPGQMAFYFACYVISAAVWGVYFNKFFDTQDEKRYESSGKGGLQ